MRDYQQHVGTRRKEISIPHDHTCTLQIVRNPLPINPFTLLFYPKLKKVPVRLSSGASPPMSSQVSSHVNLLLLVNFNFADLVQVHKHYQLAISFTVLTLTDSDSLVLQFHCTMFQSHSSLPEKMLLLLQLLLLLLLTKLLKKDPLFPDSYKIISAYHKMPTF